MRSGFWACCALLGCELVWATRERLDELVSVSSTSRRRCNCFACIHYNISIYSNFCIHSNCDIHSNYGCFPDLLSKHISKFTCNGDWGQFDHSQDARDHWVLEVGSFR